MTFKLQVLITGSIKDDRYWWKNERYVENQPCELTIEINDKNTLKLLDYRELPEIITETKEHTQDDVDKINKLFEKKIK